MSSYISLDSIWRDRITYPNAADYVVTEDQVKTWFSSAREVRVSPQNISARPQEFVTVVTLQTLLIPYPTAAIFPISGDLTAAQALLTFPCIYLDFHSTLYNDKYLISTINGVLPEARFVCTIDKIQNDSAGNPIWIQYVCKNTEQTMRFRRDFPVKFTIFTRNGTILPYYTDSDSTVPANPAFQILATFTITPYIRDNSYSNHNTEPIANT